MARFVSFLLLVAILVVIAIVFFRVMAAFLVPLFLAALLGVVVQPLHRWTLVRVRGHRYDRYLAAGITTALVAVIVLLPIGLVVTTATVEGLSLVDHLQLANVRTKLDDFRQRFGLNIPREADLRRIEAVLSTWREKQRKGESLTFSSEEVKGLIVRVENIEKYLEGLKKPDSTTGDASAESVTERPEAELAYVPTADASALKSALRQLLGSDGNLVEQREDVVAPEDVYVQQEDALLLAFAEFRKFKRDLLGGTYWAWLTEWANPSEERIDQLRANVLAAAGPVLAFGGDTLALLAKLAFGTLIMMVTLFFLLAEGSKMLEGLIRLVPLEEQHVRELAAEFDRACRAIVSATLLSAVAQGLLAGIGFYICGLRGSVALLTLLTMVLALVPFTGAAAVWIPVSLYLFFVEDSTGRAVFMAIYGAIVVSGADNVIKPLVLHGQSNLHPLLALLSVLGGIQALGPIGIIVGPMAVVFLQVLLKLVQRELSSIDRSSWMFWRGFGGAEPAAVPPAAGPLASNEVVGAGPSSATAASSLPPVPGNGRGGNKPSASKQPQQHGKKRRR